MRRLVAVSFVLAFMVAACAAGPARYTLLVEGALPRSPRPPGCPVEMLDEFADRPESCEEHAESLYVFGGLGSGCDAEVARMWIRDEACRIGATHVEAWIDSPCHSMRGTHLVCGREPEVLKMADSVGERLDKR